MPKVTFLPVNQTFDASPGESILDVAIANDVPLQHACGGFCACTTCHIQVRSGAENLSEMEYPEDERIEHATGLTLHSRLGCQAKIRGDVTVEIVNLDL
jgi:ferredoxin, 2Fe-2S